MQDHFIGIDLGGTKVLTGVFDQKGHCMAKAKMKTRGEQGFEAVTARMVKSAKDAMEQSGIAISDIRGIGVGAPGTISADGNRVAFAPNLQWKDVPLKAALEAKLGRPVWLDNDCSAATLGIHRAEFGAKPRDLVAIFIGTGIGAGIIANGAFLKGAHSNAGELGHMILEPGGSSCSCGNRGCYEALASRSAIFRKVKAALEDGRKTLLVEDPSASFTKLRSGKLRRAVEGGDALAIELLEETSRYTGMAIANLCNLLNPEAVVLGGGLMEQLHEIMMPAIRKTAMKCIMLGARHGLKITATALGDDAGITGAALLAEERSR